eukprot:6756981-Prorocentrum_lima.AAC.1
MTSSLVGSEMCIRDRNINLISSVQNTAQSEGEIAFSSALSMFVDDANAPVSYTHLTLPTICSV